ncbi:unnamed protein product [Ectocarpus sp. CCAP 1310/34]|nr:unnamed protein product [Ectocarpus sp. CCAP 1310/34]
MPEGPVDAEVSGSVGFDDDGLGLDAWGEAPPERDCLAASSDFLPKEFVLRREVKVARPVGAVQQGGEAQHVALVPVCFMEYWKGTERGGDSMKVSFRLSTTAPLDGFNTR